MTDTPTTPPDDPMSAAAIEAACRIMHDAYRAASPVVGVPLRDRAGQIAAVTVVDRDDAAMLTSAWYLTGDGYAASHHGYLHRTLLGLGIGNDEADHINGDRLDNRRVNLRVVDRQANAQNVERPNPTGYRGVRALPGGRFRAYGSVLGKQTHLGVYDNAPEAAAVALVWRTQNHHGAVDRSTVEPLPLLDRVALLPWEDVPPANQATMRAAVAALIGHLPYVEPCACPTGPNADGPVEDCPRHGRPYTFWVARADDLDHQLDALREQVHRTADRTVRDDELASRIADAATFGRCGNVNDGVGAVCMRERDHFPLGVPRTLNPHRGNGWTWT